MRDREKRGIGWLRKEYFEINYVNVKYYILLEVVESRIDNGENGIINRVKKFDGFFYNE